MCLLLTLLFSFWPYNLQNQRGDPDSRIQDALAGVVSGSIREIEISVESDAEQEIDDVLNSHFSGADINDQTELLSIEFLESQLQRMIHNVQEGSAHVLLI